MKGLKYISILAAAGAFAACQTLEEFRTYSPEDVVAPVLHTDLPAEIVVTSENMGSTVMFTWDAADFGVPTQINYSLEAAYNNDTVSVITGLSTTSAEQTYEAINSVLALAAENGGLGVPADTPTDVDFMISATIGDTFRTYYSEGVTVRMTVTEAERTYPMIYVIGDFCGWADGQTQELFSFSGDEVNYTGVIGFDGKAANGFKIRGTETGWSDDSNWGTDGNAAAPEAEAATIQLISAGSSGNITAYSHNYYRFTFNRSTLVLTNELSFDQIGVIGDFNSWGSDVVMNFDTENQVFWADVEFPAEGGFKIRKDGAWDVSWGTAADYNTASAATSGVLDGGNNIKVPAGNYRVYVNLNNPEEMTWELNAADYGTGGDTPEPEPEPEFEWSLYGATAASGTDWVDTPMTGYDSMFGVTGVEMAAGGEFLFRTADQATYVGPLASLTGDGSSYTVTVGEAVPFSTDKVNARIESAGVYDFWYVKAIETAYVANTGEKVGVVPDTYGIAGTVNNWGNAGVGDLALTEENGYYVFKGVSLTTSDKFKIRFNNGWDINYGTPSGGVVDVNTAVTLASSGQDISISLDGTYDIYFDLEGSQIYIMSEGRNPGE